jgi:hypothetical protein
MASHQLIDQHLAALARTLPPDTVNELADGLTETWQHHLATGLTPTAAAHAAITDFGTAEQITRAFVAQAPGRRTALLLLATGPVVGAAWAGSLLAAHAWTWAVPLSVKAAFGLTLLSVVATLLAAATSRRSYRRTRLGMAGGLGIVILDTAVVTSVLVAAPILAWPLAVAMLASLTRSAMALRTLRGGLPR